MEIFEIPVSEKNSHYWPFVHRKMYHKMSPLKEMWKQIGSVKEVELKYKSKYFVKVSVEYYNGMVEIKAAYPDGYPFVIGKFQNFLTTPTKTEMKTLAKAALIISKGR